MEISRSVPKRSVSSKSLGEFASHKALYDEVFGRRGKSSIPVLAPRPEDYSEIFGGFHASRSSSIPVLHIPVFGGDFEPHFDARSPGPDYAEVFGKVGGPAYTASFEDVFRRDDSSPVQSGSMSEVVDLLGGSVENARQPIGRATQLSASQSNPSLSIDPGYSFSYYDSSPISSIEEDQPCPMPVAYSVEFNEVVSSARLKHHNKHLQEEKVNCSDSQKLEFDSRSSEKQGSSTYVLKKPFITISDISLRTKPSKLPPPSRPPPGFAVENGECARLSSQGKNSENFGIEMNADSDEMVFHDVEVDEACKEKENESVKVVHADTVDSPQGKNFLGYKKQIDHKTNSPMVSSSEYEELLHSHAQEATVTKPCAKEGLSFRNISREAMRHQGHGTHNSIDSVTWREMEEYFEVTETRMCKRPVSVSEDSKASHPQDACPHQEERDIQTFGEGEKCKDFRLTNESLRNDDEMNQPGHVKEHTVRDYDLPKGTPRSFSSDETFVLVGSDEKHEIVLEKEDFESYAMASREVNGGQFGSIDIQIGHASFPVMKIFRANQNLEEASSILENKDATLCSMQTAMDQRSEMKDRNIKDNIVDRDLDAGATKVGRVELMDDTKRKIEAEMEREREREKDLMAVDKAALEPHTRPNSEYHERMGPDRTAAEMRQRTLSGQFVVDKSSVDSRIKADHVAVERANNEECWRASEKSAFGYSSLPSDLHFHGAGPWGSSQYAFSSMHDGAVDESFQRCKARLDRYRRTEDRVAKALAEKNKRDLLAQREKEERNRFSEALDAEVKRWSTGKEGNLRALLSTLQYILGPESGWQPIPLTEVITPAAVKKAYRRATLCVHPDKLQQRRATVQQKYICEKVFDLLKEAWNKFNSGEY